VPGWGVVPSVGSLWLTFTLLAALGATPPRAAASALPLTLSLRLVDPEGVAPFDLAAVHAEAERLFAPLGVRLTAAGAGSDPDAVQVILLGADRSRGGLRAEAMGAVARDPERPPVVWIVAPSVRRALGGTPQQWPSLPAPLLARAVGRILAHELVHLIAPDLPHAAEGLMRASMGRSQLLEEGLGLDPALGPTLRGRLAAGRLRPPLA
jgi:hypothetical protein